MSYYAKLHQFTFPPMIFEDSNFNKFCQHGFRFIFHYNCLIGYEVISDGGFELHFLNDNIEHLSMCWTFLSIFKKNLIKPLPVFELFAILLNLNI